MLQGHHQHAADDDNAVMTNEKSEPLPVIESWDTYWQGAQTSAAYTGGGSSHPLVLSFWDDYFHAVVGKL